MRSCPFSLVAWAVLVLCGPQPANSSAEPEYPLTKDNGPWLVVVKSFQGPQAIEFANQLARELRQEHRITTYTYTKRPEQTNEPQQAGKERGRVRQYDCAVVLAGDFKDEKQAAKARDKIIPIRPKCITREMTSKKVWEAGVLSTAFLMPNPLGAKPAEKPKPDPLLLKINSGKNSIYSCPGEYTLKVYDYRGAVAFGEQEQKQLDKDIHDQKSLLQSAAEGVEIMAQQLRRAGVEAYTYHGLYSSVVCVGSFADPQDPRIAPLAQQVAGMKVAGLTLFTSPVVVPVPRK